MGEDGWIDKSTCDSKMNNGISSTSLNCPKKIVLAIWFIFCTNVQRFQSTYQTTYAEVR